MVRQLLLPCIECLFFLKWNIPKFTTPSMKRLVCGIALGVLLVGCSQIIDETGPGPLPLNQLLSAPDTVTVNGQELVLRTTMWRNFAPIAPPDGDPLIAIMWVYSADSTALSPGLSADAAWVVNEGQIWDTYFTDEPPPSDVLRPYRLYNVARDGPKWGPGITVEVVVRLRDADGNSHLLRAPEQRIGGT